MIEVRGRNDTPLRVALLLEMAPNSRAFRTYVVRDKDVKASSGPLVCSPRQEILDPLDLFPLQTEIETLEIGAHVVGVGGAGQWHHADVQGKAKHDLTGGSTVAHGDVHHFWMGQRRPVGCQQRKPLVDQAVRGAEFADTPVPTCRGIAAVLDESRPDAACSQRSWSCSRVTLLTPSRRARPLS